MLKIFGVALCLLLGIQVIAAKTEKYVNVTANPGELCNRECVENDRRVCYFNFVLEHYHAMGSACKSCGQGVVEDCDHHQCIVGDGTEKGVMSINRMIPGPAIHVCKEDMIIIDVVNNAHGTAAALHWHGMHMRKTPHMDGVPYTTQCPIPFASTFRYAFEATEPGTKFYHSHSGHHKSNGQYGAFVIREPKHLIPNLKEYDYDLPEHYILLSDWNHGYAENIYPGLVSSLTLPESLLINGRGAFIDPNTLQIRNVPVSKFFVEPGKRYRFRVINSISHNCAVQLQIEGHKMTVIASDSSNVRPMDINTLGINSGERYDFVLTANHTKGDFWMRVSPKSPCAEKNPMDGFSLLRYKTDKMTADELKAPQPPFPSLNTTYPSDIRLNDPTATCLGESTNYCVSELTAIDADEDLLFRTPDQKFFLSFDAYVQKNEDIFRPGHFGHFMNLIDNITSVAAINGISLVFPASPPLTQLKEIDESEFCDVNKKPKKCDGKAMCTCIHRLKIKKGSIVELIIVDESTNLEGNHHPFHLHGYDFMVTGMGQHPEGIPMTVDLAKKMERSGGLPRNYSNKRPPFKDTVSIPGRGYTILRFRANNPGFWLMHCHYEWHLSVGMGLIVQVGEVKQMIAPPKNFPKCSNYVPKVKMIK
ncbi:uncharacterized protein LOC129940445 [Eupeodes corollae]|uniref:uncharacterized protein LOC129940445 n=1 Tax=Eupeodes corollae TaxID=290404 RepID=UPI002493331B|nr:uncharacterized protein LOC129940445 [Eupeodes corollae]